MTRDEFSKWLDALRKRLPDTHAWLRKCDDTATVWFEDVFSGLQYDVCVSALSQVWQEGLAAYERERLPAIIAKKHAEIVWHRSEAQRKAEERRKFHTSGFYDGESAHLKSMRRCYLEYLKLRKLEGSGGPGFVDQYFDLAADDPERCETAAEYDEKYYRETAKSTSAS